ncbi:MAG: hypothetical protein VKJ66_10705 [Synechococcus sp.]|nr:hypothetical protein [Synechococcus sp.]
MPSPQETTPEHSHNFDVQKELHRRIRNDPDYDDWEYGTEPLPHEAWVAPEPESAAEASSDASSSGQDGGPPGA